MRITHLKATDFLGIQLVDVDLSPLTLFAGHNWSGKSSVQQAVRLAVTGEVARVRLKGEYPMLIREGTKAAAVEVSIEGVDAKLSARITPTTNTLTNTTDAPPALLYLLDPPRFAAAPEMDRRVLLFTALGLALSREDILDRMVKKGADAELAKSLMPLLRAGFDGAEGEAKRQASNGRAGWKALTNEDYGKKKAETWEPHGGAETERLQAIIKDRKRRTKLVADAQVELDEYDGKVEFTRGELARARARFVCKECGTIAEPDVAAAKELHSRLNTEEGALAMLRRATDNRKRDLRECDEAADALSKLDDELKKKKEKALEHHDRVGKWTLIAELLSPDGIQNEVLAQSLKPFNDRLRASAASTNWPQVALAADMRVLVNSRLYGLCSEAERWCADAMLAEAIGHLTGLKFLMLDRMDVLGVQRRVELLDWCDQLVAEGGQVLLFATLKDAVAIQGITVYWLDAGKVGQFFYPQS